MSADISQGWASVGYVNFLFALIAACWAKQQSRSALLWFIFAIFLAPIAGIAMAFLTVRAKKADSLSKHSQGIDRSDLLATRKDVI